MILYIIGKLLTVEAGLMILPFITALIYQEKGYFAFGVTILLLLVLGKLISLRRPKDPSIFAKEGLFIVGVSWILLSVFGALPFVISGEIPRFTDAFFETVSGFTTTGASILNDVESMSHGMLFWRSFTHWVGGMGVLVFIMAFLPLSGGQNMHIMKAESPGPSVSKLVPRVKTTALILYAIYFALTLAEFIMLLTGGMNAFDALNTAFATAGTGGFGVKNDSLGGYSPYIQIVVTVFMLLFSINFNSYYFLMRGKLREAFTTEVKTFLIIVFAAIATISINISGMFETIGEAVRHSAFTVASIISTTGFSTADFNFWPELSRAILVMLMFVGACAGSTGGGIKVSRILILFKSMAKELGCMIHPKQVKKVKIDSHRIEHDVVRSVNVYMVCYMLIFMLSILLVSFDNHDLITSFTAVTATINNIGPGLELVGPTSNFAFFSDPVKIVLIFDMLAGRLELFPMLLLFTPTTWKK